MEEYLEEAFYNPFDEENEKASKEPQLVADRGGMLKKRGEGHNLSRVEFYKRAGKGYVVVAKTQFARGEIVEICPVLLVGGEAKKLESIEEVLFEIDKEKGEWALALGYGSLYNHSEEPNMDYAYHRQKKQLFFLTNRTVKAGEELTINYGTDYWAERVDFGLMAGDPGEQPVDDQEMPKMGADGSQVEEARLNTTGIEKVPKTGAKPLRGNPVKVQPGQADVNYDGQSNKALNDPQDRRNPVRTGRAIRSTGQS